MGNQQPFIEYHILSKFSINVNFINLYQRLLDYIKTLLKFTAVTRLQTIFQL